MFFFNIFVTTAFCIVQMCTCNGADVQYSYKVVSDTKGDSFAYSLATAHQRLVIGAPRGNYILTEPGVKLRAPQGIGFGYHLDVNQQFIVVSGWNPYSVYAYSSATLYTLVARIPLDDEVMDVKVLDDNSLFVTTTGGHVSVYGYTHHSSWNKKQEIDLEDYSRDYYISLAVSGDILAVGYADGHKGRVKIYRKVNDQYILTTTLLPTEDVLFFGTSVAMEGQHLVVSSTNILFTYEFDPSGGKWVMNGRLIVHSPYAFSYVSLQKGILAATVTDDPYNPEVCAYAYKLSKNSHTANATNNSVSDDTLFTWKKVATLKTNGVPISNNQYNSAISVQDGLIFTGRWDASGRDYGVVFVHDMNKK